MITDFGPLVATRSVRNLQREKAMQIAFFLLPRQPISKHPRPTILKLFSLPLMSINSPFIVFVAIKYVKVVNVIKELSITW